MLNVVMLNVVMLNVIMLNVAMLTVVMLTVVMLNVLCWMSLCWMFLCWMSLCWMSLCWMLLYCMSLCWMSWRLRRHQRMTYGLEKFYKIRPEKFPVLNGPYGWNRAADYVDVFDKREMCFSKFTFSVINFYVRIQGETFQLKNSSAEPSMSAK
jgi:hypothetical protein